MIYSFNVDMKHTILFIVFLLSLVGHLGYCNNLDDQEDYLPDGWDEVCNATKAINRIYGDVIIKCETSAFDSVQLSMNQLRLWTENRTSNFSYIYDVTCTRRGNISLPWPMKSRKMVGIYVRECTILDVFADLGNVAVETLPDELIVIDIRHSVMRIKVTSLLITMSKIRNISTDYNCGHDRTLESVVFRNVSYKIDYTGIGDVFSKLLTGRRKTPSLEQTTRSELNDNNTSLSSASTTLTPAVNTTNPIVAMTTKPRPAPSILGFTDLLQNILNQQTFCQYDNLKNLDESVSDTLSIYYHQFLVQGSRYPQLMYLNYSFNNIKVMPPPLLNWRFYFPKLRRLDISHNYISEARFKYSITPQSEVTYINITFNNITEPKVEDIIKWARIPKLFVDIRNNPIHCGCELSKFITFLRNTSFFSQEQGSQYTYLKNMTCVTPENLFGKVLGTLGVESLPCPKQMDLRAPLITLGIIAFLLFILLIVAVKYRREIRILFFTRFHILLPGDVADLERSKTYDAFVSYSNADDDWVIDTLCAKLESIGMPRRFPYKSELTKQNGVIPDDTAKPEVQTLRLCLHHRDFVPGMSITDNILNSIEASRHTIIVLSRNFVNSEWALEEFRQAYHQSIVEKRRHLIIIVYEQIPERDLDPLLKRCFKMFTYIEVSDRLFWDRIIYSLSIKQKEKKLKVSAADSDNGLAYTSVFDIRSGAQKENHAMRQFSTTSSSTDVTCVSDYSGSDVSLTQDVDIGFRP